MWIRDPLLLKRVLRLNAKNSCINSILAFVFILLLETFIIITNTYGK